MPRIICTQTMVNTNQAFFFLGFASGSLESGFMLEPSLAKAFRDTLTQYIDKYEGEFGQIDMQATTTGIMSPLQPQ
jgi:hypothetical protein